MNTRLEAALEKIRRAELPTFMDVEITGPNVKGRSFGDTPLHIMAIWGDVENARTLIEAGAEIDARGEDGFTPLLNAVGQGHVEMVRLLLDSGANPRLATIDGSDAFDLASSSDNLEIQQLLEGRKES